MDKENIKDNGNGKDKKDSGALNEESIKGNIKLNNEMFEVACDCSDEWKEKMIEDYVGANSTGPGCKAPTRFEIQRIDNLARDIPSALNESDIRDFFGRPSELKFVDIKGQQLVDMDGRQRGAGISAPGGDAAEFIRACMVWEDVTGQELKSGEVEKLFQDYLLSVKPRKFQMQTGVTQVEGLQDELRVTGLDLASPRANKQSQLLGTKCDGAEPCGLMDPSHIGPLQLKHMMMSPGKYLMRLELIQYFIRAFFVTLWERGKPGHGQLELEVLPADKYHNEAAVAHMETSDGCAEEGRAPLLMQETKMVNGKEISMYIVSADAVRARREELAKFFVGTDAHAKVDEKAMLHRLDTLGERAFANTIQDVAAEIPVFNVALL